MARAITPATAMAAVILKIGLNILSSARRIGAHRVTTRTSKRSDRARVNSKYSLIVIAFSSGIFCNGYCQLLVELKRMAEVMQYDPKDIRHEVPLVAA